MLDWFLPILLYGIYMFGMKAVDRPEVQSESPTPEDVASSSVSIKQIEGEEPQSQSSILPLLDKAFLRPLLKDFWGAERSGKITFDPRLHPLVSSAITQLESSDFLGRVVDELMGYFISKQPLTSDQWTHVLSLAFKWRLNDSLACLNLVKNSLVTVKIEHLYLNLKRVEDEKGIQFFVEPSDDNFFASLQFSKGSHGEILVDALKQQGILDISSKIENLEKNMQVVALENEDSKNSFLVSLTAEAFQTLYEKIEEVSRLGFILKPTLRSDLSPQ